MTFIKAAVVSALMMMPSASMAAVLFNGDYGVYSTDADLDKWSWSTQDAGIYQTYIHGAGFNISKYIDVGKEYCNVQFNANCQKGALYMIDGSSRWNGQTMLRTELIPQSQPAASGVLYYRFSMKILNLNNLYEHQLAFFESQQVQFKYGVNYAQSPSPMMNNIQFWKNGQQIWSTPSNSAWHNFAVQIDYSGKTIGLYWSTGGDKLVEVVAPSAASVGFSDWHVGVLRLDLNGAQDATATQVLYSNVLIENSLSTLPSGSGSNPSVSSPTKLPSQNPTQGPSLSTPAPTKNSAPSKAPTVSAPTGSDCSNPTWAQCGGTGWSGKTCCKSSDKCNRQNDWYSQCVPKRDM